VSIKLVVLFQGDAEGYPMLRRQTCGTAEGIKVLDGSAYERDGVGFAGTKGSKDPNISEVGWKPSDV
jgi:hypothetical protein